MMEWAVEHLTESLLIIGLILLILEVAILGFATFILLFIGLAALITAGFFHFDVFEPNVLTAFLSVSVISMLAAVILWRPLKQLQSNVDTTKAKSDLIGHQFVLAESVSLTETPNYHYSGVNWKLMSDVPIEAGTKVEVVIAEVGMFHIKVVV